MKKTMLKRTFLLFLLAGIVYACVEDSLFDTLTQQDPSIQEAKAWYEANKGETPAGIRSSFTDKKAGKKYLKPLWNNSFMNTDKEYKTVETMLTAEKGYGFITPECYKKYEETGDLRYIHSTTRLVVRTDLKTKKTDGFIMTITPDLKYLESSNFNPFRNNSYLKRDKKFSGFVFYCDMEGDFVNAWRYLDGVAYSISPDTETPGIGLRSNMGCTYYYNIGITEHCYYTQHEGEDTFMGCGTPTVDYYYGWWECDSTGGSGNYNNNNNGGGGTGPGGSAGGIAANSSLDDSGNTALETTINTLLNNCAYKSMYDSLKSRGIKFSNIVYDPSISNGRYDADTKTLIFRDEFSIEQSFPEEFIHFFQDNYYWGGINYYYNSARINIEFEAKMTSDILCWMKGEGYYCRFYGSGKNHSNKYSLWIMNITNQGTHLPTYAELFARDSRWGGLNYWDFIQDFQSEGTTQGILDYTFLPKAYENIKSNSNCN
ncbi:MAG: hypothetical protein LBU22_14060 [Dysgonamonadaceae bacterium]|jgi:hypothetical protein|nr:hypothetical protein [Dysgonamonadaceae bacterium]